MLGRQGVDLTTFYPSSTNVGLSSFESFNRQNEVG